jgi:hydroxymethylpyrimidine/phosphomethylpyrimidine kinase
MEKAAPIPVAMTIGGSDSANCAGIQVDLRTFSSLGVFGTTVITAVTAQNLGAVSHVAPVTPTSVGHQIRALLSGFQVAAVKTGMLWSPTIVEEVAHLAKEPGFPKNLVIDPVMVSTSGATLLHKRAIKACSEHLFPSATLLTPNLDEASTLLGVPIRNPTDMEHAAAKLGSRFDCAVLLKGGHLRDAPEDLLWHQGEVHTFAHPRLQEVTARGTGCMLSAAITAYLARGESLLDACKSGIAFVARALKRPVSVTPTESLPGIEGAAVLRSRS